MSALRAQRITSQTERDGAGVRVTVPAQEASRASSALAAAMDDIARHAEAPVVPISEGRRPRARSGRAAHPSSAQRGEGERRLVSERLLALAPVVVTVSVAVLLAAVVGGFLRVLVFVVALIVIGMAVSDGGDDDRTYGDGRDRR